MLVAIVTITVPFIFVILMVLLKNVEKHKRNQLQADLYVNALEKGEPLPANLFSELKETKTKKKRNPLSIGIICIALGSGISLTFLLMSMIANQIPYPESEEIAVTIKLFSSIGIIPFLIGIAFIIIHFIEKKSENDHA